MAKRVQMSRKHPWRAENPDAVIVARPSRWGNPFYVESGVVVGQHWQHIADNFGLGVIRIPEREYPQGECDGDTPLVHSISLFSTLLRAMSSHRHYRERLEAYITPLRGKDLACWCPLDQACHGDVLLEIANRGDR